ncbi:hypothetical protein C8J56DRAFT_976936 [Mycena floridula]|nr:hypothetical protein C8J56DRAFT_976936 [Mycena floridula]
MNKLPEELLFTVVNYLVDIPVRIPAPAGARNSLNSFNYTPASRALVAFSRVNHQFRRISLPLLFVHVECKGFEKLQNLAEQCQDIPTVLKSIRTLHLTDLSHCPEASETLRRILPSLTSLTWLDMDSMQTDKALWNDIEVHPTLTTAAVLFEPRKFYYDPYPVSKMLLTSGDIGTFQWSVKTLESWLDRGIRIWTLTLYAKLVIWNGLGDLCIPALHHLKIRTNGSQLGPWLPRFVARHPDLTRITFQSESFELNPSCIPLFLLPFFDSLATNGIDDFLLQKIVIARHGFASSTSSPEFQGWDVTGLILRVSDSLLDVLRIATILFPQMSELTIEVTGLKLFHIDDLISIISSFQHLQTLRFRRFLQYIDFGGKEPWRRRRTRSSPEAALSSLSEAAMQWYILRLAAKVPSLEAIYIDEKGHDDPEKVHRPWDLEGWFIPQRKLLIEGGGIELSGSVKLRHRWNAVCQ